MSEPKKVLFVTAPIGSGHVRAAQAVIKELEIQQPDINIKLANIFDFFSPFIGNIILKSYLKILEYFPQIYGAAYGWGNTNKLALIGREVISRYMSSCMESFIAKYSPDVVVCTHATPAGMVAQLAKKGKLNFPSIAIITDFTVHRLWVYPELDYYFVAHAAMGADLAKWGIPHSKSQTVGIPVDRVFLTPVPGKQVLEAIGLSKSLKTLLIMGGGAGVFPMDKILEACDHIDAEFQIIIVTGNNHAMYHRLQNLHDSLRHRVKIFGFVNNVHELMAAADLLISKPGGMTTAEALCKGLPMLIFRPIPGQEEANTIYLEKHKAAVKASSPDEVHIILERLLVEQPYELENLAQNASKIGRPDAANVIARYILAQV